MVHLFEDEDYTKLVHLIQDTAMQISKKQKTVTELTPVMERIKKSLKEVSNLKYAIDQSIIIAATDVNGRILYVNDKFCKTSQYNREELIGNTHKIVNSGYHDHDFFQNMWDTLDNGEIWEGEVRNKAKDGSFYWLKTSIVPFLDRNQKPYMYIALRTNITKGKENEEKLVKALKNDFNLVVRSMDNYIFKIAKDHSGHFIYEFGEGQLAHRLALETTRIFHKEPKDIFPKELSELLEENFNKAFMGQTVTYDSSFNGYHVVTVLSPIYEDGKIINIIGCCNDITELHQAKEKVEFLAYHDTLTNLPNRRKFTQDISKFFKEEKQFAFFMLDLDRFKYVNDSLGHSFGDELLKVVAERIRKAIHPNQYVYRFGGDEFIILLPEIVDLQTLTDYSNRLLAVFNKKIQLNDKINIFATGSIGISLYPDHGQDLDTLLKNADNAMYESKKRGKNCFKIYDQAMNYASQKQLQMETFLRTAILNDEFELYYQPKLTIHSNKINSMEALLRWHQPVLGTVPPDIFIPIAEETGFIWKIDEWVLLHACQQNKKWNDAGNSEPLRVAINISPKHFSHPDFVKLVKKVLKETDLAPELVELEITETSIIENTEECLSNVKKLREMGIAVAIDDFGTGFTSLNYLKKFPFDYLKIDQSYIKEILENRENTAIVKTVISLAHELDLKVIAEGVEEKSILEYLKQLGCDVIQGYYVSRPLPKNEFEKLLQK